MVLVVGGLTLAAAGLRADGGLLGSGGSAPVGAVGLVVLLAFGWAVAIGRFTARFWTEVRHLTGPTPWAERLRAAAGALLAVATLAVPVLMVVFHLRSGSADAPLPGDAPPPAPEVAASAPPGAPVTMGEPTDTVARVLVTGSLVALALVLLALLVAAVLRVRWRRRSRPAGLTAVAGAVPEPAEDALAAAVDTGRRALHGDDPRTAVIACYAAMEAALAESGVPRRDCDSPTELLERAVADHRVDGRHAYALTGLFREARYSTHPMDDAHVRRARSALDALAAGLAEPDARQEPLVGAAGEPR